MSLAPAHRRGLLIALNRGFAGILMRAGKNEEAIGVLRRGIILSETTRAVTSMRPEHGMSGSGPSGNWLRPSSVPDNPRRRSCPGEGDGAL